ncbi:MAG: carbohydrate-binding protein, partial [bacterium]
SKIMRTRGSALLAEPIVSPAPTKLFCCPSVSNPAPPSLPIEKTEPAPSVRLAPAVPAPVAPVP